MPDFTQEAEVVAAIPVGATPVHPKEVKEEAATAQLETLAPEILGWSIQVRAAAAANMMAQAAQAAQASLSSVMQFKRN